MQSQSFVEPSPVAVAFDMDSCPSSMDSAVASPKSNHRQPAGTPTVAPNKAVNRLNEASPIKRRQSDEFGQLTTTPLRPSAPSPARRPASMNSSLSAPQCRPKSSPSRKLTSSPFKPIFSPSKSSTANPPTPPALVAISSMYSSRSTSGSVSPISRPPPGPGEHVSKRKVTLSDAEDEGRKRLRMRQDALEEEYDMKYCQGWGK